MVVVVVVVVEVVVAGAVVVVTILLSLERLQIVVANRVDIQNFNS